MKFLSNLKTVVLLLVDDYLECSFILFTQQHNQISLETVKSAAAAALVQKGEAHSFLASSCHVHEVACSIIFYLPKAMIRNDNKKAARTKVIYSRLRKLWVISLPKRPNRQPQPPTRYM